MDKIIDKAVLYKIIQKYKYFFLWVVINWSNSIEIENLIKNLNKLKIAKRIRLDYTVDFIWTTNKILIETYL